MRRVIIGVCAWLLPVLCGAQALSLMEWNVENMFHPSDAEGVDDGDFTPEGKYRWTYGRFARKANMMAQVLAAAGKPDLVAMCEVEDDSTMIWLTERSVMRSVGYRWVRSHGSDRRGINVALLYDPFSFRPIETREVVVATKRATRNILYVLGRTKTDTLHVIVCHLPSQAGETREGDRNRRIVMETLKALTDSIMTVSPTAAIVVTGDMNTASGDKLLRVLDKDQRLRHVPFDFEGTYRFQGDWSHLDHVFCSERVEADTVRVMRESWLLEPNRTYGGDQPMRTFRGPSYHGGISDHLPIVVGIRVGR